MHHVAAPHDAVAMRHRDVLKPLPVHGPHAQPTRVLLLNPKQHAQGTLCDGQGPDGPCVVVVQPVTGLVQAWRNHCKGGNVYCGDHGVAIANAKQTNSLPCIGTGFAKKGGEYN